MDGVAALIPAGGSGVRLGHATPKQFLKLGSTPILVATVRRIVAHPAIGLVIVAAPEALRARTERLLRVSLSSRLRPRAGTSRGRGGDRRPALIVVAGGSERQDSVRRALAAVPAGIELVVVHDAVRPFVTRQLTDRVIAAAAEGGAAICALPLVETVKRVRDGVVQATIDRAGLWAVQTPQAFRAALLREAHDKAHRDGVVGTDEAMLVERLGYPVQVVPGSADNVKITTPDDLHRARRMARG